MYIDTHCHISKNYYDDITEVITDSKNNGLDKIIISCCDQQEYEDTYHAIYDQLKGLDCYKEGKIEVMKSKMLKEVIVHISKDCEKIALLHIAKVYK